MYDKLISIALLLGALHTFIYAVALPAELTLRTRNWTEVDCIVNSNTLKGKNKGDNILRFGTITYSYNIDGTSYKGEQEIMELISTPGKAKTCFVDPKDTTNSVIQRGFGYNNFLGLGFSLAVGLFLIGSFHTDEEDCSLKSELDSTEV